MERHYTQLDEHERIEIHRLRADGVSQNQIGRDLGRNRGTISRELVRNRSTGGYVPVSAHKLSLVRRHQKRLEKIERLSLLRDAVHNGLLAMEYSPEQIAGRLKQEQCAHSISVESIYRYSYSDYGRAAGLHRYLPRAKPKRGRRVKRPNSGLIPNRISIHDRPEAINRRESFGHWEGDLMAFSKPGQNVVVVVERTTRFTLSNRQGDKTAATTIASIKGFQGNWPKEMFQSITFDNGAEFFRHGELKGKTYFCDAHSPWQKGTVENTIGRLRRNLPKSTKPQDYSDEDFDDIINTLNHTPRKCLGFKTPAEEFLIHFNAVALGL